MVLATRPKIEDMLVLAALPGIHWLPGDGLCDCTFQRIGEWTNPYLGKTLRVRLCCIWAEIYKQFPQFVQDIDASYDVNRHRWAQEVAEWDSPDIAMPIPLWHRQLARKTGKTLAQIREEYRGKEKSRPQAKPNSKRHQPTAAEIKEGTRQRLLATGWILDGEEVPDRVGNLVE